MNDQPPLILVVDDNPINIDLLLNILKGYRFGVAKNGAKALAYLETKKPDLIQSGSGTTDTSGQMPVTVDGQQIDKALDRGSYRLTIEGTATGPDNQFISGRESVIMHKGDYYIGLSP